MRFVPRPPVLAALLSLLAGSATAEPVTRVLDGVKVSRAQLHVQQTPIVARDGIVYLANIEPGPRGDADGIDLRTVIRRGARDHEGRWQWRESLIEDRTMHDKWHSAPALGIDERGHVHIAYNMHNLPWQYKVSTRPHDIDAFEFRGDAVSEAELRRLKFENRTSFPSFGDAGIPGNQISYPAFFNDRDGRLYVTYRFAARPARPFAQRAMSAGVSRYDSDSRHWESLGGPLATASGDFTGPDARASGLRGIASANGWTAYYPRLAFGADNSLQVGFFWRQGTAGADISRPCLLVSHDGSNFQDADGTGVTVPSDPSGCRPIDGGSGRYYSVGNIASDAAGSTHMVLSPIGGRRQILSRRDGAWHRENTPEAASEIFFDADDNAWMIGSGVRVFVRRAGTRDWRKVWNGTGRNDGYPRATLDSDGRTAYVYTLDTGAYTASVTRLDLGALLRR